MKMMWPVRRKPWVAVAAALILLLATAGVAVQGRQQPAAEEAREQARAAQPPKAGVGGAAVPDLAANQALAREQLALIDQAQDVLHQLAQNGRISPADASLSLWERRRLEALRKTGAGKAEIVAALEKYIDSLNQEEALVKARVQSARGTQVGVYDVQYRRLEARIWLNEEKAR